MSYADETRLILEARNLLHKQRNKDAVVNYYVNRGMDPDEARAMVHSIFKENLTENRKSATGWLLGGGIGILVFGGIWVATGRLNFLTLVGLPACGLGLIVGVGRFLVASGYEMYDFEE